MKNFTSLFPAKDKKLDSEFETWPFKWVVVGFIVRTYTMVWLLMRSVQFIASGRRDLTLQISGLGFFILALYMLFNIFAGKVTRGKYAKWCLVGIFYLLMLIIMLIGPDDGVRGADEIASSINTLKFFFSLY